MLLGFDVLRLAPLWEPANPIVLVAACKAVDLCREDGCERLAASEALLHLDGAMGTHTTMSSQTWDLRGFLSRACMSGADLRETKDRDLIPILRQAIAMNHVVALRQGEPVGQTPDASAEQRRLVRKIERIVRTHLSYSGREYKLVVDVDLARTPSRDSYEVVGQDDAKRVLDGMATQSGTVPELRPLLGQASGKLTRDWRPPLQPDGLILLRRIRQKSAAWKDTGPAIEPSKMAKLLEQVHPLIDGTSVELDLSEAELPAADESADAEASEPSGGSSTSEDSGTPAPSATDKTEE